MQTRRTRLIYFKKTCNLKSKYEPVGPEISGFGVHEFPLEAAQLTCLHTGPRHRRLAPAPETVNTLNKGDNF